jgi:hypothetical protein
MPKKKNNKNYFTQETEDAIIAYNHSDSLTEKNRLYREYIHYPFFKLTQNIIHTFKFYNTDVEDLEHLQHEIEVFLLGKLHLYHHSNNINKRIFKNINKFFKEKYHLTPHPLYFEFIYPISFSEYVDYSPKITQQEINDYIELIKPITPKECIDKFKSFVPPKAYSYFGTIVKRWCINYSNNNYNNKLNTSDISTISQNSNFSYELDKEYTNDDLSNFIDDFIDYIENNINNFQFKDVEIQVIESLLEIFKKRENIDILHKKATYLYIYEMIPGVKTQKITQTVNKLKKIFNKHYNQYLEEGYNNFT